MSELIEVYWITGSLDEARKVSRYLVQERIVASANIIPWIESVSMLNNQLETVQESKVTFKSTLNNYDKIKEIIKQNTTYDIPEISFIKIEGVEGEYLGWLKESILIQS